MKNKMMRIASVLLVAALITTCAISGTFAKYVTKVSGEDSARVAKWGVLLSVDGIGIFADKYEAEDEAYVEAGGKYSVEAFAAEGEEADDVVAPGTDSDQIEKTLTAKVTGKPEVATRYSITGVVEDIVLPAGTYVDYTNLIKGEEKYDYTNKFTLSKDYAPVKWNLVIKKGNTTYDVAKALKNALPEALYAAAVNYGLSEAGCSFFDAVKIIKKVAGNETYVGIVEDALGNIVSGGRNFVLEVTEATETAPESFTLSYDFDPNKEMGFEFTLSWAWAFETEIAGATYSDTDVEVSAVEFGDMADTYLGNVAAGVVTDANAKTTIGATLTATAVQID